MSIYVHIYFPATQIKSKSIYFHLSWTISSIIPGNIASTEVLDILTFISTQIGLPNSKMSYRFI